MKPTPAGWPRISSGIGYRDPDYFALAIYSTLFGGGMSSPWVDAVRDMDRDSGTPPKPPMVTPSQGVHLVVDRAFLPGIAFAYEGDGHFPKKLFEGRTARVLITADTPPWYLWLGYRNGWLNVLRRQILEFVGLKPTRLTHLGPASEAKPEQVQRWVKQIQDLGAQAA